MTESSSSAAPLELSARLAADPQLDAGLRGVLETLGSTCADIARLVARARIEDVIGAAGETNVQGEEQQKLDVIANQRLTEALSSCSAVVAVASEEEDEVLVVREAQGGPALGVLFDPLDGSSNIDSAVGIGTIFSVVACDRDRPAASVAQAGHRQVAAGYALYGSQVALVLTIGAGVDFYVLDPEQQQFVLVEPDLELPATKSIYSLNEANLESFPEGIQAYVREAHTAGYSARYIGSMVADVHRTLIKGGVFLYPSTKKNPEGKLRLLYEASPMSLLVERAGGLASTGAGRILDVEPQAVHQRVPVILGSTAEVERVLAHLA